MEGTLAQQYDLYGCFQCGKCTGGCPVSLKSKLNIRRLMMEGILGRTLDRMADKEALWECTTCKTCTLRCPREMKPMDLVIGMRSELVLNGRIPKTIIEALESAYKYGNPWGKPKNKRIEWTKGLPEEVKVKDLSRGEGAEHLFYVGCTASFDPRIQGIARSLAFTLHHAGIDFGILGNEEQCCGNEIRRMGETGLFEELVEGNVKCFESHKATKILALCPHGFNALKNEYPQGKFQVAHSSQLLAKCLDEGKLAFKREIKKVVTYHDPCFLGKQNNVFDEPRTLLTAIPGITFKELDRSRERSLCCEGGGGRMWVESASETGERLADIRVKDAVELGAEVLATACPLCVLTLEDAVKTTGHEDHLKIMDINELVAMSLGLN